jgi:CheY-like chemotaxis protein
LTVADSGPGIAPDLLSKIFDPFFTTKEVGKGTGLGLSTSAAIVKGHRGFIRVESAPERGTQFHVFLPAHARASSQPAPAAAVEAPRGRGELILVVDDEAAVRKSVRLALEAFGYRTMLAADGAEAVSIYTSRSEEIAAVITDLMMPVMDGPATIRALRMLNPAIRIIAASGLSSGDPAAVARELGIRRFLPKPYQTTSLLAALREVLA